MTHGNQDVAFTPRPTHRVLAYQYPDGSWRAFNADADVVADFADMSDIEPYMAKWIGSKTGGRADDVHIDVTVVDAPTILAAEQAQ